MIARRIENGSVRPESRRRRLLAAALAGVMVLAVTTVLAARASIAFAQAGGFLETTTSTAVRPPVSVTLPTRGKFTFPAPYNTTGIRLTTASDCGGADCVDYVGYSYWRNMNNHVGSDTMYLFLGLDRAKGGSGPTLLSYNKVTDRVTNMGSLFSAASPLGWATGEQWCWSATQPTKLYVWVPGTPLYRYDVISKQLGDRVRRRHPVRQQRGQNGTLFHKSGQSPVDPNLPLLVDTSLQSAGATISHAVIHRVEQ